MKNGQNAIKSFFFHEINKNMQKKPRMKCFALSGYDVTYTNFITS